MSKKIRNVIPYNSLIFGPFVVAFEDLVNHFMMAGTSGSGKSLSFFLCMLQLLYRIGHRLFPDHRALVFDAKGNALELIARCGATCGVYDLHPFRRGSVGVDLAADIDSETFAEEFAVMLVPNEDSATKDSKYFTDAVRQFIEAAVTVLIRRAPGRWTLRDICLVLLSENATRRLLALYADTRRVYEDFAYAKEYPSVRSTIRTKLGSLRHIAAAWHASGKPLINLDKWVDESSTIVLGSSLRHEHGLQIVNRLIMKSLAARILDRQDDFDKRTFLFLDELFKFGFPEGLTDLLTEGRSKGVSAFIGFPSYSGLCSKKSLGRELTEQLLGQCSHAAFLRMGNDPATAEWAEKVIGEHYEFVYSGGTSVSQEPADNTGGQKPKYQSSQSTNCSVEKRPIVSAVAIKGLPRPSWGRPLAAYYVAPESPATLYAIPGDVLFGKIIPKATPATRAKVQKMRPSSDYILRLWDKGDLQRLNLDDAFDPGELDGPDIDNMTRFDIDPE